MTEAEEFAQDLQPRGRRRSRPTGRWSATTSPTSSSRPRRRSSTRVVDEIVERHEAGQPVLVGTSPSRSRRGCRRAAQEAGHHARGAQRQAARAGGAHRRPGRPQRRGHHRHQHGRPRHRHPPRRQPRGPGQDRVAAPRASTRRGRRPEEFAGARRGQARGRADERPTRCVDARRPLHRSAPSGTSRAASTTSCAAAPAARATRASRASTCRSRTT